MRYTRFALPSLIACGLALAPSAPAAAQGERATTFIGGGGLADHGPELRRAGHAGLRHRVYTADSLTVHEPPTFGRSVLERVELHVEGVYQGSSGRALCGRWGGGDCWSGEHTGGVSLTAIWVATPLRHPVRLYFVPGSAGVFARLRRTGHAVPDAGSPLGRFEPDGWRLDPGLGVGNGMGVQLAVGGHEVMAELRPTVIRYRGESGGMLALSLGVTF